MEKRFDYDAVSDSLIVSRKEPGEAVQGSAEIGNLILDFTGNGKIVGVEFQNISEFLEMMNIDPSILDKLEDAKLIVRRQKDAVSLFAVLSTPTETHPLPLATIPVSGQLASSV